MLTCVLIFNIILWMRKWKFIEGELIWPSCGLLSFVWQSSMTKLRHVYFCLFNCCCPNDFCIVEDSAMVTLILQKLLFYAVQYSNNRRIVLKIKKKYAVLYLLLLAHTPMARIANLCKDPTTFNITHFLMGRKVNLNKPFLSLPKQSPAVYMYYNRFYTMKNTLATFYNVFYETVVFLIEKYKKKMEFPFCDIAPYIILKPNVEDSLI